MSDENNLMSMQEVSRFLGVSYAWAVRLKNELWAAHVVTGPRYNKQFVPRQLVEEYARHRPRPGPSKGKRFAELNGRRAAVKRLKEQGKTAVEISRELGVKYLTIYRDYQIV